MLTYFLFEFINSCINDSIHLLLCHFQINTKTRKTSYYIVFGDHKA